MEEEITDRVLQRIIARVQGDMDRAISVMVSLRRSKK